MKNIRVSAAVIHDNGMIFSTQRGYGDFKGMWEFPGGKQEPGESGEDAIVREIKEELATDIKVDKFLLTVEYDYPSFHLTMDCYLCSIVNGELTLLEHADAKWLALSSIDDVEWLPADVLVVEEIKKHFGMEL